MSEGEKDFLGRWSRRKAEARDGGLRKKEDAPQQPVHKPGRMRTDPLPPKPAAAEPADEDAGSETLVQEAALREDSGEDRLPETTDAQPKSDADSATADEAKAEDFENFDFESLNYDSDYTRFMGKGVPEAVRKRALRMLWGSNPILANIDGLNDYDDDFTDAALAVKGLLKTAYNPQTGYLTEEERLASYSEEARKVGSDAPKEDEEAQVADAQGEGGAEAEGEPSDTNAHDEIRDDEEVRTADGENSADAEGESDDDDMGEGDGDDIA